MPSDSVGGHFSFAPAPPRKNEFPDWRVAQNRGSTVSTDAQIRRTGWYCPPLVKPDLTRKTAFLMSQCGFCSRICLNCSCFLPFSPRLFPICTCLFPKCSFFSQFNTLAWSIPRLDLSIFPRPDRSLHRGHLALWLTSILLPYTPTPCARGPTSAHRDSDGRAVPYQYIHGKNDRPFPRRSAPSKSPPPGYYPRLMKSKFKRKADAATYGQRSQSETQGARP
jgi:hypothetical protein